MTSKTAQRIPLALHLDEVGTSKDAARALAAEIEQIDSVKRTLSEMQQELREMYPQLSMPKKVSRLFKLRSLSSSSFSRLYAPTNKLHIKNILSKLNLILPTSWLSNKQVPIIMIHCENSSISHLTCIYSCFCLNLFESY